MRNYLDPNIVHEVAGLTWMTSLHLPANVPLRAYDYYDPHARMFVGTAEQINKKFTHPVWCRVEVGASPDGLMPEGILLRAFNAFNQYRNEITYITGTAEEIRNRPCTVASPPIWVWDYTAIGRMQLEN